MRSNDDHFPSNLLPKYLVKLSVQLYNFLKVKVVDLYSASTRSVSKELRNSLQANSAFHPSEVGKWVPAIAGKAKTGMAPIADERVDVQVKLWDPLRTCAIPERFLRWCSTKRCYIKCTYPYLYLLSRDNTVLPPQSTPCISSTIGMSHTCLCLPSHSW